MTLVEFLRARLDEDERLTKAAVIPAHDGPGAYKPHPELAAWCYVPGGEVEYVSTPEMQRHGYHEPYRVTVDGEGLLPAVDDSVGPHIARHDPARVLAEVDAKRRLLEQFRLRGDSVRATVQPATGGVWDDLLRLLALPYADHPDYDQSWRPD